jgi:osmotically-inducible protein OsmY
MEWTTMALLSKLTATALALVVVDASASLFTYILEKSTMKQFKSLSAILGAIAFASILGCAGSPTQESTAEYGSDTWITTKVKAALVQDSLVKSTEVNVETFKGVVQLSGFVSSDAAMNQAVFIARGVEGVTSVKNDMRIK